MHERIEWIDVAKALGIIAVVVGHILPSGLTTQLIYWWHMPMFFIIGGFFLKPINRQQIGHFIKRRIQPQLATYFAVGLLLVLLSRAVHQTDWSATIQQLASLLIGGRTLTGYTTTMWFINVYVLTLLMVVTIISTIQKRRWRLTIAVAGLLLGCTYDKVSVWFQGTQTLPWDADIVLLTTFFTLIGYEWFHHPHIKPLTNVLPLLGAVGVTTGAVILKLSGQLPFSLSLKSHLIETGGLPSALILLTVPLTSCLIVFWVAKWCSMTALKPLLTIMGRHSLSIMLFHKALFDLCSQLNLNALPLQIIIGLIVPIGLSWLRRKLGHFTQPIRLPQSAPL